MIYPETNYLNPDEKAWGLYEYSLKSPDERSRRRYQIVVVNRNGTLMENRYDMGESKFFKGVKELRIPALWEHTVAELRELADYLRVETHIDLKDWLATTV